MIYEEKNGEDKNQYYEWGDSTTNSRDFNMEIRECYEKFLC